MDRHPTKLSCVERSCCRGGSGRPGQTASSPLTALQLNLHRMGDSNAKVFKINQPCGKTREFRAKLTRLRTVIHNNALSGQLILCWLVEDLVTKKDPTAQQVSKSSPSDACEPLLLTAMEPDSSSR
eukprot:1075095-Amphidinium_carterae.1